MKKGERGGRGSWDGNEGRRSEGVEEEGGEGGRE